MLCNIVVIVIIINLRSVVNVFNLKLDLQFYNI